jgi:hypothetical protein
VPAHRASLWRTLRYGVRIEERLRLIDSADELYPTGTIARVALGEVLQEGRASVRFDFSYGAIETFLSTASLLHRRGYLQVRDAFVPMMATYPDAYGRPPRDLASFAPINGALLRAAGHHAGYDVHFAWRSTDTTRADVLYATPRC